jgi:hypothetical protein
LVVEAPDQAVSAPARSRVTAALSTRSAVRSVDEVASGIGRSRRRRRKRRGEGRSAMAAVAVEVEARPTSRRVR